MRGPILAIVRLTSILGLAACAPAPPPPAGGGPAGPAVHVFSDDWHTEIIAPRAGIVATGLMPEAADFPDARFLAFGWGDRDYYQARDKTIGMTLAAGLIPTDAALHVAGLDSLPDDASPGIEVIRVPLSEAGFRDLVAALDATFERPPGGRAEPTGTGYYANSLFYPATGRFHLFNTCNTWTARILKEGGVPIRPAGIMSAEDMTTRLRAALDGPAAAAGP